MAWLGVPRRRSRMGQGGRGHRLCGARGASAGSRSRASRRPASWRSRTRRRHRCAAHPLVTGEPRLRFLCSVPLVTPDGHVVGALTVADRVPRRLEPAERTALENLATLAVARLEARRSRRAGADALAAGERAEEAEEQLAREREFTDAVIQSLPGAFFLFSRDGEMLRWNARMQAATGYSSLEIAAMRPLDFIAPRDRAAVEAAIREVARFRARDRHRGPDVRQGGHGAAVRVHRQAPARGGRDLRDGIRAGHLGAQARRGADAARQGAPRPRALRLLPRAVGLGPAVQPRLLQRGVGRAGGRALRANRPSRGTRCEAGTTPTTRTCYEAAVANAVQGRERGVRVRVSRPARLGRVDLDLLARQGHAARRRGPGAAHDGHLDQRLEAQGGRGARRVPRHARPAHRASQPGPAARPPRAGHRERRAPPDRLRVHVHRPRPLQDDQRLARATTWATSS